jgi:hypothetical protein
MRLILVGLLSFVLLIFTQIAFAQEPDDPPILTVTVSDYAKTGRGCLFLSPFIRTGETGNTGWLLLSDENGQTIYNQAGLAHDFQRQGGLLTYADEVRNVYAAMDLAFTEIATYNAVGYPEGIDHHDLRLVDDKALYIVYDERVMDLTTFGGYPTATVIGTVVQEQTGGTVSFEWVSWDHFLITDALSDLTRPRVDLFHANSVDYTPGGDIIISHRGNDEITLVDYETGAVLWRLGGPRNQFALITDTVWFSGQHDARMLPNGHITVFDNGGHSSQPRSESRALEYEIDTQTMEARLVWSYTHGVYGWFMGNVQRLPNGNTLIGWGGANLDNADPADQEPALTEVTPAGEVVYEAYLPPTIINYRALRFDMPGCGRRLYLPLVR